MLAVAKLLLYGGVAIVIGVVALRRWRVFAVAGTTPAALRPTVAVAWIAIGVALLAMLLLQARALELDSWSALASLLAASAWGHGWTLLVSCVLLGSVAFVLRWANIVQTAVAMALAFALGGLGHAAADESWPIVSRALDGLHVVGVGGWIGGLFLLARFAPHEHQREAWASFSRGATVLAPLVVITGVGSSLLRLRESSLAAGIASDYGRLLLLKIVLALLIVGFGVLHRRHVGQGTRPGLTTVRAELAFAMLVLLLTGVLTGTSPPGE